jgi:hypothetical protein
VSRLDEKLLQRAVRQVLGPNVWPWVTEIRGEWTGVAYSMMTSGSATQDAARSEFARQLAFELRQRAKRDLALAKRLEKLAGGK